MIRSEVGPHVRVELPNELLTKLLSNTAIAAYANVRLGVSVWISMR